MTFGNVEMESEVSREYSSIECWINITEDLTDKVTDDRNFPPYPYKKMTCDEPLFEIEKF